MAGFQGGDSPLAMPPAGERCEHCGSQMHASIECAFADAGFGEGAVPSAPAAAPEIGRGDHDAVGPPETPGGDG